MSTPLHWASFAASELALSYILALGGDPNAQDIKGFTPLFLAVKASEESSNFSTRMVKSLLLKGADVNIRNEDGHLPIQLVYSFDEHTPETYQFKQEMLALL